MTGLDLIYVYVVMVGFFFVACVVFDFDFIWAAWSAIKGFIRSFAGCMADLFMIDTLRRKPAEAPAREPDWAAAADEVGFFDPLPEPVWNALALWTPAEREAFELDETASFIESTDRTLDAHAAAVREDNAIKSWEEWNRRMNLSEERVRAARERDEAALAAQKAHAERVARRNGANLLPDDEDDLAALQVLNRTRPSRERRREERLG